MAALESDRSEPHILDRAPVSWKVIKAFQAVEMIDWQTRNWLRFGQADVHRDTAATVFILRKTSPSNNASAGGTKQDFQ